MQDVGVNDDDDVCVCWWQLLSNVDGQLRLKLKWYRVSKFQAESCDCKNNCLFSVRQQWQSHVRWWKRLCEEQCFKPALMFNNNIFYVIRIVIDVSVCDRWMFLSTWWIIIFITVINDFCWVQNCDDCLCRVSLGNVLPGVCLSLCSSGSNFTLKFLIDSSWKFYQISVQGRIN